MADQSDTTTQRVPEMVERVARYLFSAGAGLFLMDTPTEPAWEDASPMRQLFFRTIAAGVFRIQREPTEAMLAGARDWSIAKNGQGVGNDQATGCWQAMLDAALKD